jgi:hypothetical protein
MAAFLDATALVCMICHGPPFPVWQGSCATHFLCETCARQLNGMRDVSCPGCRVPGPAFRNPGVDLLFPDHPRECPFGCDDLCVNLSHLLSVQPSQREAHGEVCPNNLRPCEFGCDVNLRSVLPSHRIRLRPSEVQAHNEVCPTRPRPCPYQGCRRADLLLVGLEAHKRQCRYRPTRCKFVLLSHSSQVVQRGGASL